MIRRSPIEHSGSASKGEQSISLGYFSRAFRIAGPFWAYEAFDGTVRRSFAYCYDKIRVTRHANLVRIPRLNEFVLWYDICSFISTFVSSNTLGRTLHDLPEYFWP